jgi:hypothetical protein
MHQDVDRVSQAKADATEYKSRGNWGPAQQPVARLHPFDDFRRTSKLNRTMVVSQLARISCQRNEGIIASYTLLESKIVLEHNSSLDCPSRLILL